MDSKKVAVIGGGAAGFFASLSVKEHHPNHQVTLFEKTSKVLSKVKISGGGRCNVTHNCPDISKLCEAYPRGGKNSDPFFINSIQPILLNGSKAGCSFEDRKRWSYVSRF